MRTFTIDEAEFLEALESAGAAKIVAPPEYDPPDVAFPQTMRYERECQTPEPERTRPREPIPWAAFAVLAGLLLLGTGFWAGLTVAVLEIWR